jgi:hypothetical protein
MRSKAGFNIRPSRGARIDRDKLWQFEMLFYIHYLRMEPERAQSRTIMRWAEAGDLTPLRGIIAKARPTSAKTVALDAISFLCLQQLLREDRLVVKSRAANRPIAPERFAQAVVGAFSYEDHPDKKFRSDAVFKEIADELGMAESALRDAVTALRNVRKGKSLKTRRKAKKL